MYVPYSSKLQPLCNLCHSLLNKLGHKFTTVSYSQMCDNGTDFQMVLTMKMTTPMTSTLATNILMCSAATFL